MSTSKFAPGPWVVDLDDFLVRAKSPHDGRMVPVARPYGVGDDGSDVPANARLIAAAPDLYEALQRLLSWDFWDSSATEDAEFARAALSKAEGKS